MGGKEGKFSVFIGFISGFLLLVAVVGGATNVSSCQVINQSGTYVLNTNITNGTVASCINITASDVILDGAGFRINGSGTGTYGVYVFSPTTTLTNVTVKNLNVTNWNNGIYYLNVQNGIIVNNTIENNYYGVYLSSSTGNTIYNNYFNNTNNAQDTGTNFWNATRTSGTNIVGGPYLGGNLWALPDGTGFSQNETACSDADEDGICDSNYTVSTGNVDYLPLVAPRVKIMINEIYYNTSGTDLTDEFIELYVWDDGWGDVNLSGYKITTFDGDNETLPDVSGLSKFGFVVIYMGSGTSDLNASDGNATIYLGRGSEMLDDAGDEVGLYDSEGNLIDFVRYGGGNGDGVSGGWSTGDAGITANNANESIQIHGPDLDNSSNWVSAHPTEGEPNRYETVIGGDIGVVFQNGVTVPINVGGGKFGSVAFSVINPSHSVNLDALLEIEGMMNFSLNFYRNAGFNNPQTMANGKILVTVTKNNEFNAEASPNGTVAFDIGGDLYNNSIAAFLGWNLAHEFYHLLEYQRFYAGGTAFDRDPVDYSSAERFSFWDEGASDYWGLRISMAQYGFTDKQMFDTSVVLNKTYHATFGSIPYNFSDILSNFNFNLLILDTGSGVRVYRHGYLFSRYISNTHGEKKLRDIHLATKNNQSTKGQGAGELIGRELIEKTVNQTFEDIWSDYRLWIYKNYNDTMEKVGGINVTELTGAGTNITFYHFLNPWGTNYYKLNLTSSEDNAFNISFDGIPNTNYSATVIKMGRNGSSETENKRFKDNDSFLICSGNYSEIILIYTQLGGTAGNYYLKIMGTNITYRDLNVSSRKVRVGENLVVSMVAENKGNISCCYNATFMVDGTFKETKTGTIGPAENKTVDFTISFTTPVIHHVDINNLGPIAIDVYQEINDSATISSPGHYVVTANINGSGKGIKITESNVLFEGDGYSIVGNRWSGDYTGIEVRNDSKGLTNVTVKDVVVDNWVTGIKFYNTSNGKINNITATNNAYHGIFADQHSRGNLISDNNLSYNGYGISIGQGSDSNTIINNIVDTTTGGQAYGIGIFYSDYSTIKSNTVKNNGYAGIELTDSHKNTLENNNLSDNYNYGITISSSTDNTFSNSKIKNSVYAGIRISNSSSNSFTDISINNSANKGYGKGIELLSQSKSNTIKDVDIQYFSTGISLSSSDDNTLANITVNNTYGGQNSRLGIELGSSNNNIISGSTIAGNIDSGIKLVNSSRNTLSGNNVTDNPRDGIYLQQSSSNNSLSGNYVINSTHGIVIYNSSGNNLTGNEMSDSYYNLNIIGDDAADFTQYIDTSNTVEGKPVYYSIGDSNTVIDSSSGYGYVGIAFGNNVTVKDLTLTKNGEGVLFAKTQNSQILNVTVSGNDAGIYMFESTGITIANSTIRNNYGGIDIESSTGNTITHNKITQNHQYTGYGGWTYGHHSVSGYPFYLLSSSGNWITYNNIFSNMGNAALILKKAGGNTIANNTVSNNNQGVSLFDSNANALSNNTVSSNYYGFYLSNSTGNILAGNTVQSNSEGIYLYKSDTNNLTGNRILYNTYDGIQIQDSNSNLIYDNYFNNWMSNYDSNLALTTSSVNTWNVAKRKGPNIIGGPFIGGNYWAYLNGSGFSRNCTDGNSDGICDSAYSLDINNIDNLPLTIAIVPDIEVSPGSYDYGNVSVGSNKSKSFVVSNTGSANLTVSNTSIGGANASEFRILSGGGSFTLASGDKHNITVEFSPASQGSKKAILRIDSNDPDEPSLEVNLTGNGVSAAPDIAVAPKSHDYGSVNVSNTSTKSFVVSNTGTANLTVSNTTITGTDAREFTIASGGGSFTLAPGGMHNITVEFSPASLGSKKAILRIDSNDPDEPSLEVNLTGVGSNITATVITFVPPTPANNSFLNRDYVYINVTSNNLLNSTLLEWNGTNESMTAGSWHKNKTGLNDGAYTYRVWGNSSGILSVSETRVVTVDTTPPEVSITSPLNVTYNNASVTLVLSRSDNTGVNATIYSVDGAANLTYSAPTTVRGLANGTHSIVVFTNDSAGNVNVTSIFFSVDIINESVNNILVNASNNSANVSTTHVFINISTVLALVGEVNVTVYSSLPPSVNTSLRVARYVEINVSDNINDTSGNLSWVYLRVNYTNSEVSGLDESTLRLYWWNPSAGNWTRLVRGANLTAYGGPYVYDAGVNTIGNYVWANISHFSIYGIGGSTPSIPSAPTGAGGVYAPEVTLLANSIDLDLAGELVEYLRAEGITVYVTSARNFSEYNRKGYVIVLGGHNAYEGVGDIVANITFKNEKVEILNNSIYIKKGSVFRSGGVLYLFAGRDRYATEKAWRENYREVAREIKYNMG